MADRRRDLAQQLFGLTDGSETQTKMAARISEAILSDLIQHAQGAWIDEGPGILVIRRTTDDVIWSTVSNIHDNLRRAEDSYDKEMVSCLRDILDHLGRLDIKAEAPIAIADSRGFRLLRLPVVNPAGAIDELLSSWNG
jgi:Cdc6-like AAA superfamily ATPase